MGNQSENHAKMEALFLNRVKGLSWNYFELDLNQATFTGEEEIANRRSLSLKLNDGASSLLDAIRLDSNGEYIYVPTLGEGEFLVDYNAQKNRILRELLAYFRNKPDAPRKILQRIFDSNDPVIPNGSQSQKGFIGYLNRRKHNKRRKKFFKKIRSEKFQNPGQRKGTIILAEGDSWFNFPIIVKDVINHLSRKRNFAIYSLAAGGDWLSNMIKSAEYIQALDRISPDVFLFSGGGNDMVGDLRLAKMVRRREMQVDINKPNSKIATLLDKRLNPKPANLDEEKYKLGLSFLNDEFFDFINVSMSQYFLLLSEIFALPRYNHIKFITQGYDFARPSKKRRGFFISTQRGLNKFLNTGQWLYDALILKGIYDQKSQDAIVYTMIYEFNEMLISLANYKNFPNLYHIDCRGVAQNFDGWYDELHLTSRNFKKVSEAYVKCIMDSGGGKVFNAK